MTDKRAWAVGSLVPNLYPGDQHSEDVQVAGSPTSPTGGRTRTGRHAAPTSGDYRETPSDLDGHLPVASPDCTELPFSDVPDLYREKIHISTLAIVVLALGAWAAIFGLVYLLTEVMW